jgi:hypothetical protein
MVAGNAARDIYLKGEPGILLIGCLFFIMPRIGRKNPAFSAH